MTEYLALTLKDRIANLDALAASLRNSVATSV